MFRRIQLILPISYICVMNSSTVHKAIVKIIHEYLPNSRILLFGSRARGDYNSGSDYDLLIITPQTFTQKEKMALSTRLDHAIVKAIRVPVDLLLNSEDEVREKQNLPGHVIRSAVREGIAL
jgi:uncharacterized protein